MRLNRYLLLVLVAALLVACSRSQIEGHVVDATDAPLSDVQVSIANTAYVTKSDHRGRYRIRFVPGSFVLKLSKQGYTTRSVPFAIQVREKVPAEKIMLYPVPKPGEVLIVSKESVASISRVELRSSDHNRNLLGGLRNFYLVEYPDAAPEVEAGDHVFINGTGKDLKFVRVADEGYVASTQYSMGAFKGTLYHKQIDYNEELIGDEKLPILRATLANGRYALLEMTGYVPEPAGRAHVFNTPYNIRLPSVVRSEHKPLITGWIADHPSFRAADVTDCGCDDDLRAARTQYDNAHPYYVVADFNGDNTDDIAVVVLAVAQTNGPNTALLVFNAPFTKNMKPMVVGVESGLLGRPESSLLFYDRKASRMLVGRWESSAWLLKWTGSAYVLER